jgi:hypothetical protein
MVTFNSPAAATAAIAALRPQPGASLRWWRQFWLEFSASVFLGHSGPISDADDTDAETATKRLELRKGYVPQVMHETLAPERVRWGAIGGAAFNVSKSELHEGGGGEGGSSNDALRSVSDDGGGDNGVLRYLLVS